MIKKTTELTPLPFQEIGISFLTSKDKALLADDRGLGKTLQAMIAAKRINAQKVLVCCPLQVRRSWTKYVQTYIPSAIVTEIKKAKQPIAQHPRGWYVINYDLTPKDEIKNILNEIRWDLVILDEAHYLKNISAQRTLSVLSDKKGIVRYAKKIWALTGTPVLNRPVELYPMLYYMFPEAIEHCKGYYDYTIRYCGGKQGVFGWEAKGARNIVELKERLHPYMLRRLKSEVLKELPQVTITPVYLEASKVLQAAIARERAAFNRTETDADRAQRLASEDIRSLRRRIGIDKIATACDYIRDLLEDVDKIVVFTYHRDVAKGIAQNYLKESVLYTGEQSQKAKEAALTAFTTDPKIKLFIAQIESGGTGIDGLQSVCYTSVFVELTYVPGTIDQAIDRLVRIGQTMPVSVTMLIHENSVDEDIVAILNEKREVIDNIMSIDPRQEIIKTLTILGLLRE